MRKGQKSHLWPLRRPVDQCPLHFGQCAQSAFAATQQAWPLAHLVTAVQEAVLWQQLEEQPAMSRAAVQTNKANSFMVFLSFGFDLLTMGI